MRTTTLGRLAPSTALAIGLAAILATGARAASAAAPNAPPPARKVDVVDRQFGVTAPDPYRWMEGNDNAELTAFLRAQGDYARGWLARLPCRDALLRRVRELGLGGSSDYGVTLAGGRTFFRRIEVGAQLPKLMVRESDGRERVLVDPTALGKDGKHASVNAYAPSPDGSLLAYDLALGGGEVSTLRVLDVATGKELPDAVERIWGESSAAWLPDGSGFFYSQMAAPREGVDPMLDMGVRLHALGTPIERDVTVLAGGAGAMPIAREEFPFVLVEPGSDWMIGLAGGAHNESRLSVAPLAALDRSGKGATPWHRVAELADSVESAVVHGDRLYLLTFAGASNRKVVSVPLAAPDLAQARVEIPEDTEATLVTIAGARDALYAEQMVGGRARLLRLSWSDGAAAKPASVELPFDGWIDDLVTDPLADGATITLQGWTRPSTIYAYDVRTARLVATGLGSTTNADVSILMAEEVEAKGADGTPVPLSILRRRDAKLDGSHPTIVYGYGGYGISQTPNFRADRMAWIERGGIFGVCHVRGGGEKGYRWQENGSHERKMNGIHDLEACGDYLVEHGYSTRGHLAAQGGSMGGILVGRAITDRPDLFAAAHVAVGAVNPLRTLAAENGANQKVELGDPETEAGFRSIFEMDPYLHVKAGTSYPATIFTVGLNDKRVAPWMTGKMAAAMQAASAGGKPVLVRIDDDAGHGVGSTRDQLFAERADAYAFLLAAMGDPDFQPAAETARR